MAALAVDEDGLPVLPGENAGGLGVDEDGLPVLNSPQDESDSDSPSKPDDMLTEQELLQFLLVSRQQLGGDNAIVDQFRPKLQAASLEDRGAVIEQLLSRFYQGIWAAVVEKKSEEELRNLREELENQPLLNNEEWNAHTATAEDNQGAVQAYNPTFGRVLNALDYYVNQISSPVAPQLMAMYKQQQHAETVAVKKAALSKDAMDLNRQKEEFAQEVMEEYMQSMPTMNPQQLQETMRTVKQRAMSALPEVFADDSVSDDEKTSIMLNMGFEDAKPIIRMNVMMMVASQLFGANSNAGGGHGHSHNGKPCGGHGHAHSRPEPAAGGHGHTHNGKPCGGHGHAHSSKSDDASQGAEEGEGCLVM